MTALQKQCLLAALGYYPHTQIDGVWGSRSREATRALQQAAGLESDGVFGADTLDAALSLLTELPREENFWQELRFWQREELRCRCGGAYCSGFPAEPSEKLMRLAEDVRAHFGRPAHATSGLRCEIHNAKVGGVANSRHLRGCALDFYIEGIPGEQLLSHVQRDSRTRYAYRIPGTDCVHMDVD